MWRWKAAWLALLVFKTSVGLDKVPGGFDSHAPPPSEVICTGRRCRWRRVSHGGTTASYGRVLVRLARVAGTNAGAPAAVACWLVASSKKDTEVFGHWPGIATTRFLLQRLTLSPFVPKQHEFRQSTRTPKFLGIDRQGAFWRIGVLRAVQRNPRLATRWHLAFLSPLSIDRSGRANTMSSGRDWW